MSGGGEGPRPLSAVEVERAASTVARAFAWHEPWAAWALPDRRTREQRLRELVAADIRDRFLPLGRATTIDGLCVSLWCPPASDPAAKAFGPRRDEDGYRAYGTMGEPLREADRLLASLLPKGDHWYLDTIATAPERMRAGLGGRLLDHDLARLDRDGAAAALDTHTPDNVAFYERRGFEVIGSAQMPQNGPSLFVMRREPRPA